MKSCAICGSHAFNMATEGVNQGAFCDRHYWQRKAEALEAARATPALPNVERKCSECGNGEPDLSLYCVRCLNNDGWHQAPEGMAIVPQELPQGVEEWIAKCERFAMIENNVLAFNMANYLRAYLSGMAIVPAECLAITEFALRRLQFDTPKNGRDYEATTNALNAVLAATKDALECTGCGWRGTKTEYRAQMKAGGFLACCPESSLLAATKEKGE